MRLSPKALNVQFAHNLDGVPLFPAYQRPDRKPVQPSVLFVDDAMVSLLDWLIKECLLGAKAAD
jgi:hypothetical protein